METATAILQLIVVDLILSGDNAVVIALACRRLPAHQIKKTLIFGTGAAIGLRIGFTFCVDTLFQVPGLKLVGGLLLFWIALKLLREDSDDERAIRSGHNLWSAVRIIVVADAVMSLDNVVAITAAARGHMELVIFGLLLSMPLILFSSTLVLKLLARFPQLVLAGATLLGWVGGDVLFGDTLVHEYMDLGYDWLGHTTRACGAAFILERATLVATRTPPTA